MAVTIIIDAGCDLTQQQAKELNVELIPMSIHFADQEYQSGVDLSNEDFYRKLATAKELPHTSQPTPYLFECAYQKVKENGNEAVVLCISSALSGTYQSAVIASNGYEDRVHIVDTQAVSVAQKIMLDYALKLRDHGVSASEIAEALEAKKADVCAFGAVDTLEYLIKGGRLSKAAGAVGSMLGIRPVLKLSDGALTIAGKARGVKATITMTNKFMAECGIDFSMPIGIGYTGNDPSVLQPFLQAENTPWNGCNLPQYQVGSTVGTHTGPGLFIAAFFRKS